MTNLKILMVLDQHMHQHQFSPEGYLHEMILTQAAWGVGFRNCE